MEIIYIIIFILTIAVIYLIYKTRNVAERFDVSGDIKQAINDTYKIDLDAMRNLGQISQNILTNNDNLTLPATTNTNNLNTTNITSTGLITSNNLTSTGLITSNNLTSTGTITSNNILYKNNDIRQYLIGALIYHLDKGPLYGKFDNLPILLTIGKFNLIKLEDNPNYILPRKIIVNGGFRVKIWAGVFNNYSSISESSLFPRPFDSQYYLNNIYIFNTPAIIENNTNSPIEISPDNQGTIQSVEIEII